MVGGMALAALTGMWKLSFVSPPSGIPVMRQYRRIVCLFSGLIAAVLLAAGPAMAQGADLSGLSPEQRRAVERMQGEGVVPQQLQGIEQATDNAPSEDWRAGQRILTVPRFAGLSGPQDIVPVNFIHSRDPGAGSAFITFGQAFRAGDVMPDMPLGVRVDGNLFPVQMDVKALHADGSVRHAVLTANLRGLSGSGYQGMLVRAPSAPSGGVVSAGASGLSVSVSGYRANGTPFSGEVALDAAGAGQAWLSGPFVRERSIVRDIGPLLTVRADHRVYADGSTRTRFVFENHKSFAPGTRDMTYAVAISDGRGEVFRSESISHYRGSNWSHVITGGLSPQYLVQQDPAYLAAAGAILPYDLGYGIAEQSLSRNAAVTGRATQALSNGLLTKYMPSTGGRPELGPLPAWDVAWLKTQDEIAFGTMLHMADTAGSVPWHYGEDTTGEPVRVDERPLFWADDRGAEERRGRDQIPPAYFEGFDGGWSLDTAHKPLLSYTAYLATGDAYYARELAHEAAFAISTVWPDLRGDQPNVGEELQLRGRAWALRDVAAAAWLLPDAAPLKGYFREARDISLAHMARKYIDNGFLDAAGETEGWFEDTSYRAGGGVPPWQNDYMVITLAHEALRGSRDAARLVQWAENYQAGRFLDTGTSPDIGAAYVHMLNRPDTQIPVGNWQETVFLTRQHPEWLENFPDYGAGYVASAYAALILTHRVTGSTRSLTALQALASTQGGSKLFDVANPNSVYVLPGFLMTYPTTDGR